MITVLLALLGAASYGVSDFIGGMFGKRASAWAVAATGGVGGAGTSLVLALVNPGDPAVADLAWGAAAGIGAGIGTAFLYRGLASGRMGVVAPVSGVLAVVLPVVVGVVTGERPGTLVWLGIVAAIPAIWLVAREPSTRRRPARTGRARATASWPASASAACSPAWDRCTTEPASGRSCSTRWSG